MSPDVHTRRDDLGGRAGPPDGAPGDGGPATMTSSREPIGAPETIGAFLARSLARFGDRPLLGEKRDGRRRWIRWNELGADVRAFGFHLHAHGVGPRDRVVVFCPNRAEMLVAELATMSIGAVYTPIFAGYSPAQALALIEHSGALAVLVPDAERLCEMALPETVRLVLAFDSGSPETARPPGYRGALSTYEAARRAPRRRDRDEIDALFRAGETGDVHDPCLLMYTSGTSGEPKGVLLSHDNILSQQRAMAALWSVTPDDVFLSYLPWHHSFGGIFEKYTALYNGARYVIDESRGKDLPVLLANWREVRPTVYFSVPKIFQQLVSHVETHPEDEERVFHEGLRFVFTAAAPLPATISRYFGRRGLPVIEGWGLTETSPCCTVTDPEEARAVPGVVGRPIPGVTLRIAGDGEILVRGPNVMRGYHRDPDATAAALRDGWFHTGDLGALGEHGLRLISRKDRVFKMLNAEKVVPTKLENALVGSCKYIQHAVVVGSGRDFLAALIFPNYLLIEGEFGDDRARADRVVRAAFREAVTRLNDSNEVGYEHVQAFAVVDREPTVESGELTPSMKVRVQNVLESRRMYVEAIYDPSRECDCCFLRKVMRLRPDDRRCFRGKDVTLDRCHECGSLVFDDTHEATGRPTSSPPPAGTEQRTET